jgi:hypothetical protein
LDIKKINDNETLFIPGECRNTFRACITIRYGMGCPKDHHVSHGSERFVGDCAEIRQDSGTEGFLTQRSALRLLTPSLTLPPLRLIA